MLHFARLGAWLCCCIATSLAVAEGKWYQVEVLAFEHATTERYASEQWPAYPGFPDISGAVSIREHAPSNSAQGFTRIPTSEWNFNDSHRLLNQQKHTRVLLHTRWRQYLDKEHDSLPVHLYGGTAYATPFQPTAPSSFYPRLTQFTAATMLQPHQQKRLLEKAHPWELEGRMDIRLSRYLHVDADFVFQKPIQHRTSSRAEGVPVSAKDWAQRANVQLHPFRLTQSLRARSKEVHYLDHPLFGLLVRITPED